MNAVVTPVVAPQVTYGRIDSGVVQETITTDLDITTMFNSAFTWVSLGTSGAEPGWTATQNADGSWTFAAPVVVPPTIAELAASLEQAVQAWLDQTAQANGYASMDSCVSYLGSSVAQWAADAKAGMLWRDAVWQACFADQTNPTFLANPPTATQLLAGLPQPATYGWTTHAPGATT